MRSWMHTVTTTLLALAPAALASREARAEGCVPGVQISCPCLNGSQGVQVCADGGDRYGACQCAERSSAAAVPATPAGSSAPAASPETPKGTIHLATVSSPGSPPSPPSAPPSEPPSAASGSGAVRSSSSRAEPTAFGRRTPRASGVEAQPERNQTAMNIGLGLTIFGGLAFPVGGLWLTSQVASGGYNEGCTISPGPGLCTAAGTVFGLGAVALAIGVPLLVVNLTRPAPTSVTAAAPIAPAWQPTAVLVGRSNVRVVWAF
jgi:hypothetical protein